MTVGLNTGYPGLAGTVNYTINNTGTIPAKVTSITLAAGTGVTIINPGPYSAGTLGDSPNPCLEYYSAHRHLRHN